MFIPNTTVFVNRFPSLLLRFALHRPSEQLFSEITVLKGSYSYYLGVIWPEFMSYEAWMRLLRSLLWFIGRSCVRSHRGSRMRRSTSRRYRKFLQEKARWENNVANHHAEELIEQIEASRNAPEEGSEPRKEEAVRVELITVLKKFWEVKHCDNLIEKTIPDRRNPELVTYSKQSIMMAALSIFLFRMGSGNQYDTRTHDDDEKYSKANIAKFIDAPEDRVPVIKTLESFLKNLEESRINDLMIAFFKDLMLSKFFKLHPQIMLTDSFLLAADCVHTHTYDHPHKRDLNGNNCCDCCLKRIYNKGTVKEKTRWIHNTLVFSFVFASGLKIPIYRYPIHAKQVVNLESESEERHKQECELVALKMALPTIRKAFPRMKIVLLLDGLYANRPVIKLAGEQRCGYIIVRKESCLPTLGKECDEVAATSNHKKNCTKRRRFTHRSGWSFDQKYEWFNRRYLGNGVSTHVLRFLEDRTKEEEEDQSYYCEWLFSWPLSARSCETAARLGRCRWHVEDLFNTLKNRGFTLRHDYSRDPRSCFNWQGLALFAFGLFELFRFSEAVKLRGTWSQVVLAKKLIGQLIHMATENLFSEAHISKRIQFRYNFVDGSLEENSYESPLEAREGSGGVPLGGLNTG